MNKFLMIIFVILAFVGLAVGQPPITVDVKVEDSKVCVGEDVTLSVEVTNTSNRSVAIDRNSLLYMISFRRGADSKTIVNDAGSDYRGKYLVLRAKKSYHLSSRVDLTADFFKTAGKYEVAVTYGNFNKVRYRNIDLWMGSVVSDFAVFRVEPCVSSKPATLVDRFSQGGDNEAFYRATLRIKSELEREDTIATVRICSAKPILEAFASSSGKLERVLNNLVSLKIPVGRVFFARYSKCGPTEKTRTSPIEFWISGQNTAPNSDQAVPAANFEVLSYRYPANELEFRENLQKFAADLKANPEAKAFVLAYYRRNISSKLLRRLRDAQAVGSQDNTSAYTNCGGMGLTETWQIWITPN